MTQYLHNMQEYVSTVLNMFLK